MSRGYIPLRPWSASLLSFLGGRCVALTNVNYEILWKRKISNFRRDSYAVLEALEVDPLKSALGLERPFYTNISIKRSNKAWFIDKAGFISKAFVAYIACLMWLVIQRLKEAGTKRACSVHSRDNALHFISLHVDTALGSTIRRERGRTLGKFARHMPNDLILSSSSGHTFLIGASNPCQPSRLYNSCIGSERGKRYFDL